jgi:hypothetical protein
MPWPPEQAAKAGGKSRRQKQAAKAGGKSRRQKQAAKAGGGWFSLACDAEVMVGTRALQLTFHAGCCHGMSSSNVSSSSSCNRSLPAAGDLVANPSHLRKIITPRGKL